VEILNKEEGKLEKKSPGKKSMIRPEPVINRVELAVAKAPVLPAKNLENPKVIQ